MSIVPLFWGNYEISITNLSLTVVITMFLGVFLLYVFLNEQIVPRNWQIILESLFMFVFRVIKQQTGNEGLIYFPLVFSLFVVFKQLLSLKLNFYLYLDMFLLKKNKALMTNQNNLLIKRDYGFDGSLTKGKASQTTVQIRDGHPKNLDIITKDGKLYMIDVNYTYHEVVVLHGVDTITQNVGIDAKNATTSYIVIDDIVYKEIKTRDQLKQALIEIDQNYQDKEVTDFPSQTHQNIRHELKIRDPSIEFLAPVAQSKKQFIATVEQLANSNAIQFIDQATDIVNTKKD